MSKGSWPVLPNGKTPGQATYVWLNFFFLGFGLKSGTVNAASLACWHQRYRYKVAAAPLHAGPAEGPTGEGRHAVNGEGAHQVCMETSNRRGGGCGMQHAIDRRRSRLKYIWPDGRAARRSPSPPGTRPIGRAWESFIVVSSLPYPPARLQYSSMQR
jgi:hypothetical protein